MLRKILPLVSLILITGLCACGEEPVEKTSFGRVDPLQEGEVLTVEESPADDDEAAEDAEISDDAASAGTLKRVVQLDTARPTTVLKRMTGLCDALNMGCVMLHAPYSSEDYDYIWNCVACYVVSTNDRSLGFTRIGDAVDADHDVITDVMYAMFGKLRQIPPLPAGDSSEGGGFVEVSSDMKYRFREADRELSASQLRRATQYSDGSLEMEVALVDSETGDEFVSFIYTMRANTRDTSSAALFEYEITGARPADGLTRDKMSGVPFLATVMQTYGYDTYDKNDIKYNEVSEVLNFRSFLEYVPGMDELNAGIEENILTVADRQETDEEYHSICSYPLTTGNFIQLVTTVADYPGNGSDPDIYCYCYDKVKLRATDKNDAMLMCDITEDGLLELIASHVGAKTGDISYTGFVVRADGSADVYYSVADNAGITKAYAYNSATGKVRSVFEEGDIIPADECDDIKPVLTHGRK